MTAPISSFRGKYLFLSNFYPVRVFYDELFYPSAENAYQAAKTLIPRERIQFLLTSAKGAKLIGRRLVLREDWEDVKLSIMRTIVRDKFQRHPRLADQLLATGKRRLIEGNHWHDTYWGVCNGVGQNRLGRILMRVRRELRESL